MRDFLFYNKKYIKSALGVEYLKSEWYNMEKANDKEQK